MNLILKRDFAQPICPEPQRSVPFRGRCRQKLLHQPDLLPPVILLIGWAIYGAIDDKVEGHAGALYDRATGTKTVADAATTASATGTPRAYPDAAPATDAGRRELDDGLTDEQRRMLDELGKG